MTVREQAFDVLRELGMTRIFGNPGSTEIPFLTDLPADFDYVLGLHEGPVVGMASGYALGSDAPAFVNVHTAAGLGNAVNAIVCARDNRIPLVITVGQQDRRQLDLQPFLTGRSLERLAGDYPVWSTQPAHPSAVPGAIARAAYEARLHRGPALVIVPMGDWDEELEEGAGAHASPSRLVVAPMAGGDEVHRLAGLLAASSSPTLVVGAGLDSAEGWSAAVALAERLACPVWQDTFSSRAGFPQDHPQFAGHLPWQRSDLRNVFAGTDVVLAVGTPAFRLYLYDAGGPLVDGDTKVAVLSEDHEEVVRSVCDLGVVAAPAPVLRQLAERLARRPPVASPPDVQPGPPADGPLRAEHLVAALAERLPADAILVEEAPSTRPEILARIKTRSPLGFVAVANGALGFGLAGAVGLRMALPNRPVVALLGDGSAMYSVHALWTAAHYGVGTVFVIVGNGRYGVMDELARRRGAPGAWPSFDELDLTAIATGLGCPAERITTADELEHSLDAAFSDLAGRTAPLLLDVRVAAES